MTDYLTLSPSDKLLLARDRLRGLESDHYRLEAGGLLSSAEHDEQERRLKQIAVLQSEITNLEKEQETIYARESSESSPRS